MRMPFGAGRGGAVESLVAMNGLEVSWVDSNDSANHWRRVSTRGRGSRPSKGHHGCPSQGTAGDLL
jgi:hypothetical protein